MGVMQNKPAITPLISARINRAGRGGIFGKGYRDIRCHDRAKESADLSRQLNSVTACIRRAGLIPSRIATEPVERGFVNRIGQVNIPIGNAQSKTSQIINPDHRASIVCYAR